MSSFEIFHPHILISLLELNQNTATGLTPLSGSCNNIEFSCLQSFE